MPAHYQTTLVWRWSQAMPAGANEQGDVVRALKKRKDMPHMFANRGQIYRYLVANLRLQPDRASTLSWSLWESFSGYRDAIRASFSTTPVSWDADANAWTTPQDGGFDMDELMKVSNRRQAAS